MTPEVENYYENYFDLFTTDGWKQYVEQVEAEKDNFSLESVKDDKDLYAKQGQLYVINNILNFESMIRTAYDSLKEDEDVEAV